MSRDSFLARAWNGRAKRAWYDYLTDHEGEAEDVPAPETLADAVARVHALIRRELQALGDGRRLFVPAPSSPQPAELSVGLNASGICKLHRARSQLYRSRLLQRKS